jgi:hypothetical protein
MGMTVGNMFLCETCTASVITEDMFAKKFAPAAVNAGDLANMLEAVNAANAVGIAERCRAHGLSATQAKAKAKELAKLYWNDPAHGGQAIKAFWTSPGPKQALPDRTSEQPLRSTRRRWWHFWK